MAIKTTPTDFMPGSKIISGDVDKEFQDIYDDLLDLDLRVNARLPTSGGTMTGKLTLDGNPTSALHAVPKQYLEGKTLKAWIHPAWSNTGWGGVGYFSGVKLRHGYNEYGYGGATSIRGCASATIIYPIVISAGSGNIKYEVNAYWASDGEVYNQHWNTEWPVAKSLTSFRVHKLAGVSLSSCPSDDDIITASLYRKGLDAEDTLSNDVLLIGFLVNYTGSL